MMVEKEKRMSALEVSAAVRLAVALRRKDPNANYDAVSARIAFRRRGFRQLLVLRTYVASHRRAFVHATPKRGD